MWLVVSYWFEQMNYTYKKIWLIAFPVMMSILIEQLINITDALFLGHVGDVELGASALAGIWFLAIYMLRSEERRVGKECRSRWSPYH